MNGKIALDSRSTEKFVIPHVMYRINASGGVAKPMIKLTHMMMAKCRGWTPMLMAAGAKTGPRMRIETAGSMTIHTTKSKRLTIKRKR